MKHRILLVLILLVILVSCSKEDFTVSSVKTQSYVCHDGRMGLSVYIIASQNDEGSVQFSIKDPSGTLSWSLTASKMVLDGTTYVGSSDVCMPLGSPLPEGTWSLDVMYKDGTTVTRTFEVDYGDVNLAMERYLEEGTSSAWYDSAENLTVLPDPNQETENSDDSSDLSV